MKPDMKKTVGIIAAMKSEIDALKAQIVNPKAETISGVEYISGTLFGIPVVAAQCGIGKVFAAICAQTMILTYRPSMIINIGVAGALSPTLCVGDIAIAGQIVHHDLDTSAIGDPVGLISGINQIYLPTTKAVADGLMKSAEACGLHAEVGTIASGDIFVSDSGLKKRIISSFGAIACDMESASIGHVCYVNGVDCGILRAMSDSGDENAQLSYTMSLEDASNAAMRVMETYLKSL